jgi:hypothetical protein
VVGVKPSVLVAHSASWIGVARLPLLLRAAGATVTIMCPEASYLGETRHADHRITAPAAVDEFAIELRALLHRRDYTWVILADDPLITAFARYADDPVVARALPVTSPAALAMMSSKIAFLAACKRHALPLAPSETVRTLDEARAAAAAIGYPVMLKLDHGSGGIGVKRIDDPEQLAREFTAFARDEDLTVEGFAEGRMAGTEVLYDRGVPLCWSWYYKEKIWPGEFGPSSVRRFTTHPQVGAIAERLGAITGFHGFAVLCFVDDTAHDRIVLLEMNFRPGPGMHVRGPVREMFGGAARAMLAGAPYEGRQTPGAIEHAVHLFPQDLYRAIGQRDCRGMLDLLAGGIFQDLPFDDPRLLSAHLRSATRSGIAAIRRNSARRAKMMP